IPVTVAIGIGGAGAGIAAVGLLDDRFGVLPLVRFLVHLGAALWFAAWCSDLLSEIDSALPGPILGIWAVLMLVAIVWAVNLFNFMDGLDGLGGSQGLFVAGLGSWFLLGVDAAQGIGLLLAVVAAAAGGFLVWNLSPARIFLGDVGSGFLGLLLAALPLLGSAETDIPVATWVILWGVFLVDATVTLLRRMALGERWYQAHRQHAYQRLSRRWSSHGRVTGAYLAVNLLWLAPMACWSVVKPEFAVVAAGVALAPLVITAWLLGAGVPETDAQVPR
ncbi:MAG: glycosyl transferase, partial [Gammaproteobacteria bacterium]